jgi:Cu(I)/Ag(I) efflux system membrane fusion protein
MIRYSFLALTVLMLAACSDRAPQAMGPEIASAQTPPVPDPAPLPGDASAEAKLADAYLRLSARLASDDPKGAAAAAAKLGEAAGAVSGQQAAQIKAAAGEVAAAAGIAAQRTAYERASNALIAMVEAAGNPLPRIVYVARCPMAFDNRGARWLQDSTAIRNPYFGASMLTCGSIEAQYAPGARKP